MGELIDAKTEMEEKLGATATDGITHEESWERLERIVQETSEQMKETYRRMRETDCQMKQMSAEVWAQIKETGEQMKETDHKLEKMYGQFTTQWGRIVEEVAKPAALKLFMDIGIDIDHVFQEPRHRKRDEMEMEVDVILVNTTAVVAVEVKTTLKQKDVDYFLKQMENFKELFREFKAVKTGDVWNSTANMYQEIGGIAELFSDFHTAISGDYDGATRYLTRLK